MGTRKFVGKVFLTCFKIRNIQQFRGIQLVDGAVGLELNSPGICALYELLKTGLFLEFADRFVYLVVDMGFVGRLVGFAQNSDRGWEVRVVHFCQHRSIKGSSVLRFVNENIFLNRISIAQRNHLGLGAIPDDTFFLLFSEYHRLSFF